ncbi:MAG: hypothetical protein Q7S61_03370 [bacterium]|nr:hypothetical protein [bacterium]
MILPSEDSRPSAPYDRTLQTIRTLRAQAAGSGLIGLVDWFPSPNDQKKIAGADLETKAGFAASVLGHWTDWSDATQFLHINRPQDGETAAEALGLTRDQAIDLNREGLITKVNHAFYTYTDFVVDDLLNGDVSSIAKNLKSAGQVVGFQAMMLHRSSKQEERGLNLEVIFDDGSSIVDRMEALTYLMFDSARNLPVQGAVYNPETYTLQVQLPHFIKNT